MSCAGQTAVIFGCEGLRLSKEEKAFFQETRPFGFILFARNIDTPDQVRALCAQLRAAAGHEAPILIDQEGGRVQRLRAPHWREWPAPLDHVAQAGAHAARVMYLRNRLIAQELFDLGIDSNCAPMVDVATKTTHEFLRNRCYGSDPAVVAELGAAVAEGLLDGGVLPVVKHIPGHGRATADSHFELPHVAGAKGDLMGRDFAPFAALKDQVMGMTAHIVYPDISEAPATICPKMMRVIREDIGFGGLLMTDDINMKALSGSLADLSRASLEAGCDVILHCNGVLAQMAEVAEAAGALDADAVLRADRVHGARRSPTSIDIEAMKGELESLT